MTKYFLSSLLFLLLVFGVYAEGEKALAEGDSAVAEVVVEEQYTYFDVFVDKVRSGGFPMFVLILLSIFGLGKILERLLFLKENHFVNPEFLDAADVLYHEQKYEELTLLCQNEQSVISKIVYKLAEHKDSDIAELRQLAQEVGSREIRKQLDKAYPIAVIAAIAPMIGLFGTVMGLIGAFDTVAKLGEMGNASILADDIAMALVTTGGGLAVAIPMLFCYHFFKSKTKRFAYQLEESTSDLLSKWFKQS